MVTKDISELEGDIREAVRLAVFATHAYIVEKTPVAESVPSDPPYSDGHTGGRLRQSIVVEPDGDGWIIGTAVPYAEFVEVGVSPHIIRPNVKQAIKFYADGGFVFAGEVMHPGFEGRRMFQKGVDFFEKELDRRLQELFG